MRLLLMIVGIVVLLSGSLSASAEDKPLVGMAQLSRSDGLLVMMVVGSFPGRDECERAVLVFIENVEKAALDAGFGSQTDFAACDFRVPAGSEFDALLNGTTTGHYIFFTPSFRAMQVYPRGTLEYERQVCELMRGQMLSRLQIDGRCDPPPS